MFSLYIMFAYRIIQNYYKTKRARAESVVIDRLSGVAAVTILLCVLYDVDEPIQKVAMCESRFNRAV